MSRDLNTLQGLLLSNCSNRLQCNPEHSVTVHHSAYSFFMSVACARLDLAKPRGTNERVESR